MNWHCVKVSIALKMPPMNLTQCRMARAALNWSLDDLAAAASVARRTIARFEAGENVQPDRIEAIRKAMEGQGIRFLTDGPHFGAVVPPEGRRE